MKQKGFTLIELLAVIVILAIIALIATPIVLNIISDSKENAQLRSTEFYLDGVEYSITKKIMDEPTFKPTSCEIQSDGNLKCDGTDVKVDISGEVPNSGKICISSKGTVDRVMVKYSNYYVSYDGKETNISDKDTFNSFSCDSVGGNTNKVAIFNENDKEFVLDSNIGGYAISGTIDATSIVIPELYDLVIDDNTVTQLLGFYQDSNLMFVNENVDTMINVSENNAMVVLFNELTGTHNVKIFKSDSTFNSRTVVRITEEDKLYVLSADIVPESTVTVSIVDHNNNELYNDTHDIENQGSINGLIEYDLSSVYSKLSQNNEVTITVTQTYNGKQTDIYNTKSVPKAKAGSPWTQNKAYYYWGNDIIPFMFT